MDKSTFSIVLSVIAIILACTAAFSLEFNIENSSFTLGTLTLLVTLLIGWQIYSKIEIDDRVRKMIDEQVSLGANTALFVALAQLGRSAFNKGDRVETIQSLFNALCIWDKRMTSPLAKEAYDYCVTTLSTLDKGISFLVEDVEEKDAYVKAAIKTGHRELIDFATQITVRSRKS